MRLIDSYDGREYSLGDLYAEYTELKSAEPLNHSETFAAEIFEVLMASVNGRNDLDIVGPTPAEINRYIARLRKTVM